MKEDRLLTGTGAEDVDCPRLPPKNVFPAMLNETDGDPHSSLFWIFWILLFSRRMCFGVSTEAASFSIIRPPIFALAAVVAMLYSWVDFRCSSRFEVEFRGVLRIIVGLQFVGLGVSRDCTVIWVAERVSVSAEERRRRSVSSSKRSVIRITTLFNTLRG